MESFIVPSVPTVDTPSSSTDSVTSTAAADEEVDPHQTITRFHTEEEKNHKSIMDNNNNTATYTLPSSRWGHSMTTFADGKILIFGGLSNFFHPNYIPPWTLSTKVDDVEEEAEYYDSEENDRHDKSTTNYVDHLDVWLYDTQLWYPVHIQGTFPLYITNRIWGHTCTPITTTNNNNLPKSTNTINNNDAHKYQFLIVGGRIGAKPCTCEIIYLCTVEKQQPSSLLLSPTIPSDSSSNNSRSSPWTIRFDTLNPVGIPPKKRYNHSMVEISKPYLPSFLFNDPTAIDSTHYLVFGGHGGRRRYFNDLQILRFEYIITHSTGEGLITDNNHSNNDITNATTDNDNRHTNPTNTTILTRLTPRAVWELVTLPTGATPSRRAAHTMNHIHSSVYILMGGFDGACILSDIFIFSTQLWHWSSLKWNFISPNVVVESSPFSSTTSSVRSFSNGFQPFPPLVGHSAVTIKGNDDKPNDNYLVVYGGTTSIEAFNNSIFVIDFTKRNIYSFSVDVPPETKPYSIDDTKDATTTTTTGSISVPSARCWQRMVYIPYNQNKTEQKDDILFIFGGCSTEAVALSEPWYMYRRQILGMIASLSTAPMTKPFDTPIVPFMDKSIHHMVSLPSGYTIKRAIAPSLLQVGIGGFGVAAGKSITPNTNVNPVTVNHKPLPYDGLYKSVGLKIVNSNNARDINNDVSMGMVMTNITSLPIPSSASFDDTTDTKNVNDSLYNATDGTDKNGNIINTDNLLPYPGIRSLKSNQFNSLPRSTVIPTVSSFPFSSPSYSPTNNKQSSHPRILVGPGGAPATSVLSGDMESVDQSTVQTYPFPHTNNRSKRYSPRYNGKYGGANHYNNTNYFPHPYPWQPQTYPYQQDNNRYPTNNNYNNRSSVKNNGPYNNNNNRSYDLDYNSSSSNSYHNLPSFDTQSYESTETGSSSYLPTYSLPTSSFGPNKRSQHSSSNESVGNISMYPTVMPSMHNGTTIPMGSAPIIAAQQGDNAVTYYSTNDGGASWYPVSFVVPPSLTSSHSPSQVGHGSNNNSGSSTTSNSTGIATVVTDQQLNTNPVSHDSSSSGNVVDTKSTRDAFHNSSASGVPVTNPSSITASPSSSAITSPYPVHPPYPNTSDYNAIMLAAATASMVVQQYHYLQTMNTTVTNNNNSIRSSSSSSPSTPSLVPALIPITPSVYYPSVPMIPAYNYPINYAVPTMYPSSFVSPPNGGNNVTGNNTTSTTTTTTISTVLPHHDKKDTQGNEG